MRYDPHIQAIELEGFGETRNFTIAASGKAFRNLMDGLYSRKIEAAVREICTNAHDSHTAAGRPHQQFHLQLPTFLKPYFAVRDYGVGMPHEQVMERYSKLFDSTKDQTNEFVGMLGLGSKSPFAYTDGFTLRCWDGEERRTYASYLGEGGVPLISHADTSPSAEPRGVEVSFPVKNGDQEDFRKAASRVLKGFSTLPTGLSREMVSEITQPPIHYGDGWALTQKNFLPGSHVVYALQGCVLYPVDVSQLRTDSATVQALNNLRGQLILDFDMGLLEFTPGREELSYTDLTIKSLREAWEGFQKDANDLFEMAFVGCESDWQRALVDSTQNLNSKFGGMFRMSAISRRIREINVAVSEAIPWDSYARRRKPENYPFTFCARDGTVARESGRRSSHNLRQCTFGSREIIFVRDRPEVRARWKRLSHYLVENDAGGALVYDNSFKIAWDKFGNPPLHDLADMPDPPRPKRLPEDIPSWDRYLALSEDGWQKTTEADKPRVLTLPVVFVHKDFEVVPETDQPVSRWRRGAALYQLRDMHNIDTAMGGDGFVLVRMRGNEVYRSWKKRRLFKSDGGSLVDRLKPADIARLTNIINWERFESTYYSDALEECQQELKKEMAGGEMFFGRHRDRPLRPVKVGSNPILALSRFEERYLRIDKGKRADLEFLRDHMAREDKDHVIQRALDMGLEVLPETEAGFLPVPLLPLRWENMARMLAGHNNVSYSISRMLSDVEKLEKES